MASLEAAAADLVLAEDHLVQPARTFGVDGSRDEVQLRIGQDLGVHPNFENLAPVDNDSTPPEGQCEIGTDLGLQFGGLNHGL